MQFVWHYDLALLLIELRNPSRIQTENGDLAGVNLAVLCPQHPGFDSVDSRAALGQPVKERRLWACACICYRRVNAGHHARAQTTDEGLPS